MSTSPREMLDRLDARHNELVQRLEELNAQIEAALAEFARTREAREDKVDTRAAA